MPDALGTEPATDLPPAFGKTRSTYSSSPSTYSGSGGAFTIYHWGESPYLMGSAGLQYAPISVSRHIFPNMGVVVMSSMIQYSFSICFLTCGRASQTYSFAISISLHGDPLHTCNDHTNCNRIAGSNCFHLQCNSLQQYRSTLLKIP